MPTLSAVSVNLYIKKAFMLTRERFGMNPVAVLERSRTLGASAHSSRSPLSCNETN